MQILPKVSPPLHWRLTSWLAASPSALPPEASAELRAALFSRMSSLWMSAGITLLIEIAAVSRHPTLWFKAWLIVDGGLLLWLRLVLVVTIMRYRARQPSQGSPPGMTSDCFLLIGLVWCASLGCGTGLCAASGDAGLSVAGAILAMATAGAIAGRVPGSPRLARLQLCLLVLPFAAGGVFAVDPLVRWMMAMAPIYLLGLASINRQLHIDYVEMVVGRQENRRLALRCVLTGLPNRRMFDNTLVTLMQRAAQGGVDVFVLCLDLDGFKLVNDRFGHAAGDMLLKEVSARLLHIVPADGLVSRFGGDEFAVVMTALNPSAAEALASRIVETVGTPIAIEGQWARVGVSVGISRGTGRQEHAENLIREADQALYGAKGAGKNTFRWYQPMPAETQRAQRRSTDDVLHDLRPLLDKTPACGSQTGEPRVMTAEIQDADVRAA